MSETSSSEDETYEQEYEKKSKALAKKARPFRGDQPVQASTKLAHTTTTTRQNQAEEDQNDQQGSFIQSQVSDDANEATERLLDQLRRLQVEGTDAEDDTSRVEDLKGMLKDLVQIPGIYHALQTAGFPIDIPPQDVVRLAHSQLQALQTEVREKDKSIEAKDARLEEYSQKASVTALESRQLHDLQSLYYGHILRIDVPSENKPWLTPTIILEHAESIDLEELTDDPREAWLEAIYTTPVGDVMLTQAISLAVEIFRQACGTGEVTYQILLLLLQNLDDGEFLQVSPS